MLETDQLLQFHFEIGGQAGTDPAVAPLQIVQPADRLVAAETQEAEFRLGEGRRLTLAGANRDGLAVDAEGEGNHVRHFLRAGEGLVLPGDVFVSDGRREKDLGVLVEGLFHRAFQTLDDVHLLVEVVHVAHGLETHVALFQPAQAHPLAAMAGSEFVTKGHGSGKELLLVVHANHQLQHPGEMSLTDDGLLGGAAQTVIGGDVVHEAQEVQGVPGASLVGPVPVEESDAGPAIVPGVQERREEPGTAVPDDRRAFLRASIGGPVQGAHHRRSEGARPDAVR